MFDRRLSAWLGAVLFSFSFSSAASAQAVKPWFLLVVDTSGSMCGTNAVVANSCGFSGSIKMNAAKCAIQNMLNQTGDADFGLMQFNQPTNCGTTGTCNDTADAGWMRIAISPSGAASIFPLVDGAGAPTGTCNGSGTTVASGDNTLELCSGGGTPLAGSLKKAQQYFNGSAAGFDAPTNDEDFALGCRPMNVILLTDGMETCGGTPANDAANLLNSTYVPTEDATGPCTGPAANCVLTPIRTYVIGFGISSGDPAIEAIATSGGTDNSTDGTGGLRGYYAGDEAELSEALARIIFESQLNEVCNGVDDDCDSRVDEGSPAYCDVDAIRASNPSVRDPETGDMVDQATTVSVTGTPSNLASFTCDLANSMCNNLTGAALITCCADTNSCCDAVDYDDDGTPADLAVCAAPEWTNKDQCNPHNRLCESPGELCDGLDNDCDGEADESPFIGTVPPELCNNGIDDDCDRNADEGCAGCVPETCNDDDDDCDGYVDEDLNRPCGFDLGPSFPASICEAGTQTCVRGEWGAVCPPGVSSGSSCSAVVPRASREVGDPLPANWVEDGGTCVFQEEEACDELDNDCDTLVDDIPAAACTTGSIPLAQLPRGICKAGMQFCDPDEADLLGPCQFEVLPATEICNGLDDDCDGFTDEAPGSGVNNSLTRECGTDAGICVKGVETCVGAVFQGCTATTGGTEVCNAVSGAPDASQYDEDCDSRIDETDPAIPGQCVPGPNGAPQVPGPNAGRGECTVGSIQCISGALRCSNYQGPTPEQCDDIDSDCDGFNNNGVGPTTSNPTGAAGTDPTLGTFCFPASYSGSFPDAQPGVGRCTPGTLVCDTTAEATTCVNFGTPAVESCDGTDQDCDGAVDEDVYGPSDSCQSTPPYAPPREFCGECVSAGGSVVVCRQSLIDDVAGAPTCQDLGYGAPVNHGGIADCCGDYAFTSSWALGNLVGQHNGEGECSLGVLRCINGQPLCDGEVTPVDEQCDGEDNDCDGETDEYIPTEGQFCGSDTGVCERGQLVCTGASGMQCMNQMTGGNEQCDGQDNDCDGFVDEGNPGGGAQCGGNTDNCMRREDPTDTNQAETEPCGDCDWGVEICVTQFDGGGMPTGGQIECLGDTGPIDELCDGRDNDCDSKCLVEDDGTVICPPDVVDADDKIDEGVDVTDPNVGMDCGEEQGECEAGELVCTGGGLVCTGGQGPVGEICNGVDDDCDGIDDDGIPVGAPCGSDVGECSPGSLVCDADMGMTVCQGGVGPSDEICDGLDNDCDGEVDDGLGVGEECGSDVGECMRGTVQCVSGREQCVGQQVPTPESCDCSDNDCDGTVDEGGDLCGGGAACVMCQCALPCIELDEFTTRCPQGKAPVENDEGCFCVGEVCQRGECAEQTIEVSSEVVCAPDSERVGSCVCKNNECTFRCSGVSCSGGLVCDPTDGLCKEATCLLPQFACEDGQRCGYRDGSFDCVEDECDGVRCAEDEACMRGECIKSCARVECGDGERCAAGECVEDHCPTSLRCEPGEVCNPEDGDCVPPGACFAAGCRPGLVCDSVSGECGEDPCLSTRCPTGELCNRESGECELRCAPGLLFCGGECVDPNSSRTHCGASGDCTGSNAGEVCAEGLACSRGSCSESCDDGLVNCGGECIDPVSDRLRCGASDDCEGENAGETCQTGFACEEGRCKRVVEEPPGAGSGGDDEPDSHTRVIASGGGGCTCSVPGAAQDPARTPGGLRGVLSLSLLGLSLLRLGRRRRLWAPGAWLALLVAVSAFAGSGCKVETFCLDCPNGDEPDSRDDGGGIGIAGQSGGGGAGGRAGGGGASGDGGGVSGSGGESGADGGGNDAGCVDTELCNGLDDDCDGTVDEDADPADVGIDIQTDALHCGGCGQACAIAHAFNRCVDAECGIDRSQGENGCDTGYIDFDGDEDNGCEYHCTKTADDDTRCDLIDNDCDHEVDDDVAMDSDPDNCGSCGFSCRFANAAEGGTCVDGECVLDATKCDEGFKDLDGLPANGCERRCNRFPTADEECNLVDDDCDGKLDEGVAATDPLIGVDCGTDEGECEAGTTACVGGAVVCQGEVRAETEVCDGDDNDCDGDTDESDPVLASNPQCGSSIGACERGVLQCVGGERVCGGATFVGPAAVETCNRVDDDCDGFVDEAVVIDDQGTMRELDDGVSCSTRSGMLDITPSAAAQGACSHGTLACLSGQLVCQNEVLPATEKCDDIDQDCDGEPVPSDLSTLDDDALGIVCSNQLGICGTGTPGRTTCVNVGTAGAPDWEVRCSAGSVTPEPSETCDGEDDDCDGRFDENAAGVGSGNCHLVDNNNDGVRETYMPSPLDTGECTSGNTFCTGGRLACIGFVGPRAETCNGLNDDCDTMTDENPQFAGTPCNVLSGTVGSTDTWNLFGVCTAGTWTCPTNAATAMATGLQCVGGVRPAANETCNGLDDDCDGDVDEQWVATGAQPQPGASCCPNDPSTPHVDVCGSGASFANCGAGTYQCAGGQVSCVQASWSPSAEVCDLGATHLDNDCDGQIDEGYRNAQNVYTNIDNCGGCGPAFDCRAAGNQVDNAIMACTAGQCEIVTCEGGYFDDPSVAGEDCDLFCPFFAGDIEICDGEDNDCDGTADEAADLQAPVAATFCDQDGACAGATPVCTDIGSGVMGWACSIMPEATDTCDFNAGTPGVSNVDEDCDGRVDEGLTIKSGFTAGAQGVGVGKSCLGPGAGDCQDSGVQVCDPGNSSRTTCVVSLGNLSEVTEDSSAADDEVCNGDDDDCDGEIDEPCTDAQGLCMPNDATCISANTANGVLGCVIDAWAQLDGDTWIYAHEASRPDAENATQGVSTERACAQLDRLPWTGISYAEAVDACEAAGARLCARSEWRQACTCGGTGTTGSPLYYDYGWPSAGGCTTTHTTAETQCNIADANAAIAATGDNTSCYRTHNGTGVYDLSGNVKELTLAEVATSVASVQCDPETGGASCRIQVRGGASSNTAVGSACGYGNSYWPNDAPYANVGFRCCFGPDPRLVDKGCTDYNATGLPTTASTGSGVEITSNLTVSTSTVTAISSVRVTTVGSSTDINDLTLNLVRGGSNSTLVAMTGCSNNTSATFSATFDDGASASPSVTGACNDLRNAGTFRPASPLSTTAAFGGQAGNGTWQLQISDNDGNEATTLTSWSLRICGYGPE